MQPRGLISFVFDDGYERVFQNAVPALEKHRFPGVFAVAIEGQRLEKTEQRSVRAWESWKQLTARGHEIASHTVTHPNLTKLSPAQLEQELRQSHELLDASTLVYPGGAVNDDVVAVAKRYYTAARTVQRGFASIPPTDPFRLHSYNFSRNNFSVGKANLLALWACVTNQWLIETYHMIDDAETGMVHSVRTTDFARHLDFVARLPIAVKTIRDVCR